jgi:hypothetical protein
MEVVWALIQLLGNVTAFLVIVHKILSDWLHREGTPELRVVKESVAGFREEMRGLNQTIKTLAAKL